MRDQKAVCVFEQCPISLEKSKVRESPMKRGSKPILARVSTAFSRAVCSDQSRWQQWIAPDFLSREKTRSRFQTNGTAQLPSTFLIWISSISWVLLEDTKNSNTFVTFHKGHQIPDPLAHFLSRERSFRCHSLLATLWQISQVPNISRRRWNLRSDDEKKNNTLHNFFQSRFHQLSRKRTSCLRMGQFRATLCSSWIHIDACGGGGCWFLDTLSSLSRQLQIFIFSVQQISWQKCVACRCFSLFDVDFPIIPPKGRRFPDERKMADSSLLQTPAQAEAQRWLLLIFRFFFLTWDHSKKTVGNDLFRQQKYEEAAEAYTAAINLDPTDATFFANRVHSRSIHSPNIRIRLRAILNWERWQRRCKIQNPASN